ncbi:unnamed protein product, partial [Closterium sp. NIES-53]
RHRAPYCSARTRPAALLLCAIAALFASTALSACALLAGASPFLPAHSAHAPCCPPARCPHALCQPRPCALPTHTLPCPALALPRQRALHLPVRVPSAALPAHHAPCPSCAMLPALPAPRALPCQPSCTVRARAALHAAQPCLALPGCCQSCPARCLALTCPVCSRCLRAPALPRAYRQLPLPPAHAPTVATATAPTTAATAPTIRATATPIATLNLAPMLLTDTTYHGHFHCHTSAAAECAGISLPEQLREWAIWWGSPVVELAVLVGGSRFCYSSVMSGVSGGVLILEVPVSLLLLVVSLVDEEVLGVDSNSSRCSLGGGGFRGTLTGGVEAPGSVEATNLGACDSASTGVEPKEALHNFTLDSGTSRSFFHNSTTVTPLTAPVPVTLADSSAGPIVARGATVLPCATASSGLLTCLHLPSFAKNLVATSVFQDQWVSVTKLGGELVAIRMNSRTGEHLATFTRRPGSGLYTLTIESALVAESGQVAASVEVVASFLCRLLTHQTLLWHHRLRHPSLPRLCGMHSRLLVSGLPRSLPPLPRSLAPPCLPCVEGRQRATPHSSFPPTTSPLQTLHMDVWGPARVTGQGGERYFLQVVDDYTRYTTSFPFVEQGGCLRCLDPLDPRCPSPASRLVP